MSLTSIQPKPVEELFHGVIVSDPYRWLEERADPQTEDWLLRQRQRYNAYFSGTPELEAIEARVAEYLNIAVVDAPIRTADREFYIRRQGTQEQGAIFFKELPSGREHSLVDPTTEGRFTSVAIQCTSKDGSLLAYQLKHGANDAAAIRIIEVDSRRILPDKIDNGYNRGFTFASDNSGFYYCQDMPVDGVQHVIRFHRFGTPPSLDLELFKIARTSRTKLILLADDRNLGALCRREDGSQTVSDLYLAERVQDRDWRPVFANKSGTHIPFLKHGRIFVVRDAGSSANQIVELTKDGVELGVVVPEWKANICSILPTERRIYILYQFNLRPIVTAWLYSGAYLETLSLPERGTISFLSAAEDGSDGFFYCFESFASPRTVFEYIPLADNSVAWSRQSFPASCGQIAVREAVYHSNDLTPIPMSLVMRAETDPSSAKPVIMTAYGAFGVCATPQFSVFVSILLEQGATFALPHIRGGGEFGRTWHEAARGIRKQVSFDDFVAATEWLYQQGLISDRKLAIFGGSHAGLLVAAAMTQRPELYRAVLCTAPILDMIRYERFGRASKWRDEYGTPVNKADFQALFAYSPYHHVRDEVNYPAVLFVTGDQDDRCDPAHVRKMAARLEGRPAQLNPVLVDYSRERGHSPVLPLTVRTGALARRIAFFMRELGMPWLQGGTL